MASTISFPEEAALSHSSDDAQFYSSFVDAGGSSNGFQMNPLSSHPPRSPRHSMRSSYHEEEESDADSAETGEEELAEAQKRVRVEDVWRDMILTSNGRDKAFKLIQYTLKLYLLFHHSLSSSRLFKHKARAPWAVDLVKRLTSTASGLSFTRKTLLLFNWLAPLTIITAQQSVPFSSSKSRKQPFLQALLQAPPPVLLELVHALSDDAYTCSVLGLVGKKFGERAARFGDWCWMLATLVGLVQNGVERGLIMSQLSSVESRMYQETMNAATNKSKVNSSKVDERELSRLQNQDYWLGITRTKLFMDLIFVSYDIFKIKRGSKYVQTIVGFISGILSAAKLFDKHQTALAKTLL